MKNSLLRFRLAACVLLFASLQCMAQSAPATAAKSRHFLLWKVSSPTATVYMAGSIHLASKDAYPLPAAVETAFNSAKVLAVEVDVRKVDQLALIKSMQKYGFYMPPDALSKHIPKETADLLEAFCKRNEMDCAPFEIMKPWLVSMTAAVLPMQKAGADPKLGIDMHFLNGLSAAQRVEELETIEFQLGLLSSPTEAEQVEALTKVLKMPADTMAKLQDAYFRGDTDYILKMLKEGDPAQMKRLLDDRNAKMAERIEKMLKGNETAFVVVGLGHVVGDAGLAKLLEMRNYKVERLTLDW